MLSLCRTLMRDDLAEKSTMNERAFSVKVKL